MFVVHLTNNGENVLVAISRTTKFEPSFKDGGINIRIRNNVHPQGLLEFRAILGKEREIHDNAWSLRVVLPSVGYCLHTLTAYDQISILERWRRYINNNRTTPTFVTGRTLVMAVQRSGWSEANVPIITAKSRRRIGSCHHFTNTSYGVEGGGGTTAFGVGILLATIRRRSKSYISELACSSSIDMLREQQRSLNQGILLPPKLATESTKLLLFGKTSLSLFPPVSFFRFQHSSPLGKTILLDYGQTQLFLQLSNHMF